MRIKGLKMKRFAVCAAAAALLLIAASCVFAADFTGSIEPVDDTSRLLAFYVNKFTPEELTLVTADKPDASGYFSDIYMDLKGVRIEGMRLDRLTFRMYGAQFNEPEKWAAGEVECRDAMNIHALAALLQDDVNRSIEEQTFGDDDHWHDVSLAITPRGLVGSGYYAAKVMFVTLDIRIDIESGLKIMNNRELWLDNPQVKINRLDLPDYITQKALAQIQPLIDLNRFPLPLRLHSVKLTDGRAELSTRTLPQPVENGITYHYTAGK